MFNREQVSVRAGERRPIGSGISGKVGIYFGSKFKETPKSQR